MLSDHQLLIAGTAGLPLDYLASLGEGEVEALAERCAAPAQAARLPAARTVLLSHPLRTATALAVLRRDLLLRALLEGKTSVLGEARHELAALERGAYAAERARRPPPPPAEPPAPPPAAAAPAAAPAELPLDEFGYPDDGDPLPRFVGELRTTRPGKRGRAGAPTSAVAGLETAFAALNSAGRRRFIAYHDPRSWDGLDFLPDREAEQQLRGLAEARAEGLDPAELALAARAEAAMAGWDEDARARDRAALAELTAAWQADSDWHAREAARTTGPAAAPPPDPAPPGQDPAPPDPELLAAIAALPSFPTLVTLAREADAAARAAMAAAPEAADGADGADSAAPPDGG